MISKFKAVFFDAGGTLFHPYPSVGKIYEAVAAKYGAKAGAEELEKKFHHAWLKRDGIGHLDSRNDEKIEREWWRSLVREVFSEFKGIRDFETFFVELYDQFGRPECWRIYPEIPEVLKELKKQGKRIGIISNWDSRLFNLCDAFGLEKYVDFVLASAVFGSSKPGPKIFQEALRRAGATPGEAVHIGDSLEDDVKGAKGVGMHAILINHRGHFDHDHVSVFPDVPTIHSLRELIAVI